MSIIEKALTFQRCHRRGQPLIVPNPWDAGSAKVLAALGFEALATTSAGLAFSLGKRDAEGALSRDEVLENARRIVEATSLPVTADLENGFGDSPEEVAYTIHAAAKVGLVGGSIEDATGNLKHRIYDFNHAVERVAAGVEAARSLPFPFVFVARAENFICGRPDLDDTLRRLIAFQEAGADVLFAPGLPDLETIRLVCAALEKPVNVLMSLGGSALTVDELAQAGVQRISLGSSLARAAMGAFIRAAEEVKNSGTFSFSGSATSFADANRFMTSTGDESVV
ncbi:isocitrate lyase/phosphoenolpyruvate mutase family protein [Pseudomonas sp. 10B1]|uniref:isocitrate lyase/PEP mutase family protein n=1 Tax=unclassified Pseudomonas TaxID=196821 RepID=UPI002AB4E96C|nr:MULTISPECIES: isocitrate lyase/phosphoenolpyruvate mutase family protein [unclassified Pseudomonas]MDY7559853.1 isocitrate lyase/phosphoenolpyruvate mutase family protein [Pseudomonas sp. AB6]MEA9977859.1 isocitrate lyase/phosphoenolpyruvate mutase family protein [Pseudomonas sp. RTS4]MEA9992904.1 isocitrate lyase/phosphoenolpyruvate mutase family protein [Pseudomonas sp. AA4]MEB0089079.1 isocitrate lyase/phosphoenolpyruvate mutase family protein [Pseudomonas sp. RTI1]MEB0125718.1 isocitrat